MTLQDISIPNLLGGVSQQPENLRFRNQAKESINAYPSLVEGLIKRRPSEFVVDLGTDNANSKMHLIDRSPTERYAVYLEDEVLRVYDLVDNEYAKVVNADGNDITAADLGYLQNADFVNDVECLSVADYTFILNKSKFTDMTQDRTTTYDREALVTVIQAVDGGNYRVTLNGTTHTVIASGSPTPASIAEGLATAIKGSTSASGAGVRIDLQSTTTAGNTKTRRYAINGVNAVSGTFKIKVNFLGSYRYNYANNRFTYDFVQDGLGSGGTGVNPLFESVALDYNASEADIQNVADALQTAMTANGEWGGQTGAKQVHTVTVANPSANATINDGDIFIDIETTNDDKAFGPGVKTFAPLDNKTVRNQGADFSIDVYDSTLYLRQNDNENFTISISDDHNITRMSLVKDEVQSFTDLPKVAPDGFRVKVAGVADETADDYYVRFKSDESGNMGEGVWEEAAGGGMLYKIDAATMPHILVNDIDDNDGTVTGVANKPYFTYRTFSWDERNAGDDETNPVPSFVNEQIKAVVFHRGRLGLFSGESVCLSEVNQPGNFFRVSVVDLLDSDRIDITAATDKVSLFKSAITNRKDCVVFSDQTQFRIDSGGDLLTPATATLQHVSSYKANAEIRPVPVGELMFFGFDRTDFSGINQLVNQSTGTEPYYTADEVSEQVPKYIKGKITQLAASELERVIACKADGDRFVYMYKYADINRERVQGAWFKFDFGAGSTVRDFGFIDSTLYLAIERAGHLNIEKVQLQDGVVDSGELFMYRLDCRVSEADCTLIEYEADLDRTKIHPGFLIDGELQVMTRTATGQTAGQLLTATYGQGGDHFYLDGDQTGTKFYCGLKYTMQHDLGAVYLSAGSQTGSSALISGRLQVRYIDLLYDNSLFFEVDVTPQYRDTTTAVFSGFNVESGAATIGQLALSDGTFRVPVFARNNQFDFQIKNSTAFPSGFTAAEVRMRYDSKGRRVG